MIQFYCRVKFDGAHPLIKIVSLENVNSTFDLNINNVIKSDSTQYEKLKVLK